MNLQDFEEVEKWLVDIKPSSRESYTSAMKVYMEFTGLNPTQLIDEAEEDRKQSRRQQGKPEQRLAEFYNWLVSEYVSKAWGNRIKDKKKGISKKRAVSYVGSIRSFYKRNGFSIMSKTPRAAPKKENRKMRMTSKEVKKLVSHAPTLRDRAIILMMFQGGFDVATLSSLNYGDVEFELKEERVPMLIDVVREKEEVDYFTFVGHDSIDALRSYLNDRRSKGDEIKLNTPLFILEGNARNTENNRIKTHNIQSMLKHTALRAGLISEEHLENSDINPCRPHALRMGFSNILKHNKWNDELVNFMMGHSIGYDRAYFDGMAESIRADYGEVEPKLSISNISPLEKRLDDRLKTYRDEVFDLQQENKELKQRLDKIEGALKMVAEVGLNDRESLKELGEFLERKREGE